MLSPEEKKKLGNIHLVPLTTGSYSMCTCCGCTQATTIKPNRLGGDYIGLVVKSEDVDIPPVAEGRHAFIAKDKIQRMAAVISWVDEQDYTK